MWMTRVAISNPVFCAMVMFALMVMGAVSYMRLPVDSMPDVQVPIGVVYVAYPGASPQAVENDLTKPIENALNPISGVKKIRSRSREGSSLVIVEFDMNIKMDVAIQDMRDKLAQVRPSFPKEAKDPYISKANNDDDQAVVSLGVTSKTMAPADVAYYVEEIIRKRLENVTGVATVDTIGAASREVRIEVDPAKLRARRIGVDQVIAALRNDNIDVPVGIITSGVNDKSVRIDARFKSIADFENLVIARRDGMQVRVSDIGVVVDGTREQNSFARIDGSKAVILDMKKVRGTNTVEVGEGVKRAIERVKKELPKEIELSILSDQSRYVKASVKNVQRTIIEGAILTVFIVFLFLASWRSTVITALTLPISVVATFIALYAFGFTLNSLTLMALSLCIGLLIDDAIVVRENIVRHLHMGKSHAQAAQEATDEIGLAVLATTLAIVAVFTPIAFMGGIIGLYFFQFGITIVVAVMVSLFVSFTLDPMLSSVWPDPEGERFKRFPWLGRLLAGFDRGMEGMQHRYERVMRWALSHRKSTIAIALGSLGASVALMMGGVIGSEFVPRDDQSEFGMRIETPVGSSLDYTLAKTEQVEAVLRTLPEVKRIYSWVGGGNGRNTGRVTVLLVPRDDRKRSQKQVEDAARELVKPIAGLTSTVGWNRPIQIALLGPDVTVLSRISQQLAAEIAKIPGAVEVETSEKAAVPALAITLKRAEAAEFGITPATLGTITRTLVAGDAVTTWLSPQGNSVDVSVRLPSELKSNAQQLMQIPLNNPRAPDGEALALERVALVSESANPKIIERSNLQRQITVSAGVSGKTQGEVGGEANRIMKEFELPPGYRFDVGGDNQMMAESFGFAMLALGMAVVFIYFVLGSQFHSFAQPIAIMMTLPLSLIGVLIALAVTRTTFNLFAMIAFIMLMGLVVKNGILLVDFANQVRRERGLSVIESLVTAGHIRLRPILMTTAAMVFGMLPMALALEEGADGTMGRAIIGGVLSSTLLTLIVVPVIYAIIEEWKERRAAKRLLRKRASVIEAAPAE
ncbi:MAG: efflux RND transporter permease subunit [Betaproteobacteria bacterium]|nr:MAG: efflux RND transporter permease subunit [Betaproteobacteria bacterium]